MEHKAKQQNSNESNHDNEIDGDVEDFEERVLWKQGSPVLVYSRSNYKWYDGVIAQIFIDTTQNEWLVVQYNKNRKKKTMQRNCKHLKPIPFVLSLQNNSFCLIYSDLTNQWCKGRVIEIYNDSDDGELLKVKYLENNSIKMCDIQRDSKQLKPLISNNNINNNINNNNKNNKKNKKKQKDKNGINTAKNIKPSLLQYQKNKWNIDNIQNNMKKMEHAVFKWKKMPLISPQIKPFTKIVEISKSFTHTKTKKNGHVTEVEQIYLQERKKEIIIYLDNNNINNMKEQYMFDSFILDAKTKEGRIINQWLAFIYKKEKEITFKDLLDFIQKIAHTFIHSYTLQANKYYQNVLILCYRCILRQDIIKRIVYNLLNINIFNCIHDNNKETRCMNNILCLDAIYQKKVMWMRVLDKNQLGIKNDYWIKKIEYKQNNKNSKQQRRRLSQIGLMAGDDVAFAKAINLTGKLQLSNKVIIKWENEQKEIENENNENNEKKNLWQHKINDIPFLSLKNSKSNEKDDEKGLKDEKQTQTVSEEIVPFILPCEGLSILIKATKCIESTAIKYFYEYNTDIKKENKENEPLISQDILLPIIIYCVIQSKLETPNRLIYFLENILPNETITMGQSAWALSQLKAAVKYIQKAKPETFGMDNEIELD